MNIASGSSGNATYVGNDHTHILIDTGVSRKRIREGLKKLDLGLEDLTAILITHEHTDHVSSLMTIEKTREIPVYMTGGTAESLLQKGCLCSDSGLVNIIKPDSPFLVGDITVMPVSVSHDAKEPVCFRLSDGKKDCAVVTDLGEYDETLIEKFQGLSGILLEANHDLRMLETGPYPYPLKQRIWGRKGHLSNEYSGKMLSRILHDDMRMIALGHLSETNNSAELAKLSVEYEIDEGNCPYRRTDFRIDIADPKTGTQIYTF